MNIALEDTGCCYWYIKNDVSIGIRCDSKLSDEAYNLLKKDLVGINVMGIPLHVSE